MQCICLDMVQVKIRCLITNLKQTLVKSQSDKITKQIINQRGLRKREEIMWKPEFLSMVLSAAVSLLTLFTFFQNRMTSTEKRLTILEEKNKQNDKELEETKNRLDNHDLQMQVLIQMTEQIKNLSEKIEKIDNKLEELS